MTYRLDHQSGEQIAAAQVAALNFRQPDKDAMPPTLAIDPPSPATSGSRKRSNCHENLSKNDAHKQESQNAFQYMLLQSRLDKLGQKCKEFRHQNGSMTANSRVHCVPER